MSDYLNYPGAREYLQDLRQLTLKHRDVIDAARPEAVEEAIKLIDTHLAILAERQPLN